ETLMQVHQRIPFLTALGAASLAAAILACGSDPTEPDDDPGTVVAELELDMHRPDGSTAAVTGPVLEAGKAYRMIIQGTYSIWDNEWNSEPCGGTPEAEPMFPSPGSSNVMVGVDAEFYFAVPSGSVLCNNTSPQSCGTPSISLDGGNDF